MDTCRPDGEDLLLHCHIQPGASRDAIAGLHGGRIKLQVASPPVDGKANDRLIRFLADTLGVPRRQISIEKGGNSRHKTVRVRGLSRLPDTFIDSL